MKLVTLYLLLASPAYPAPKPAYAPIPLTPCKTCYRTPPRYAPPPVRPGRGPHK